jgi:hypothetical protein
MSDIALSFVDRSRHQPKQRCAPWPAVDFDEAGVLEGRDRSAVRHVVGEPQALLEVRAHLHPFVPFNRGL